MDIAAKTLQLLLTDENMLGIKENDYKSELFKGLEQKRDSYQETFLSLLTPELQKIYYSIIDMEDYILAEEFEAGKIVGFAMAFALFKIIKNPLETYKNLTETQASVESVCEIDDKYFKKALDEYKKKEDIK